MRRYDVIVLGAGLMGCFAARHLAKRGYSVAVLERENDVSMGISRANTAVVYAGYDMKPGTLKARLTVKGNATFDDLCSELRVPFKRTGSLMLASGPRGFAVLEDKLSQGLSNGVPGLRLLDSHELQLLEPGVSNEVIAALYSPTTGVVNPWDLCLAAARDAIACGVHFCFEHEVIALEKDAERNYLASCANDTLFKAPVILNATGVDAHRVHELVAPANFRLTLTSGSYLILDSCIESPLNHVIFSEPEIKGKGATMVPTLEGNIMLGPSEEKSDVADHEPGFITTQEGLNFVQQSCAEILPKLPLHTTIRNFGTMRPRINRTQTLADGSIVMSDESIHDFYIAWAEDCPGFLDIAGIKTPGLTCANGIGQYVADMTEEYLGSSAKAASNSKGKILRFAQDDKGVAQDDKGVAQDDKGVAQDDKGVAQDDKGITQKDRDDTPLVILSTLPVTPSKARSLEEAQEDHCITQPKKRQRFFDDEIICRCKQVSAAEVRAAIQSSPGARTVDGIKRRVGCGMGRCQGGFCMERVMLILADELGVDPSSVVKDRTGSWIIKDAPKAADAERRILRFAQDDKGVTQDGKWKDSAHISSLNPKLLILGGGAAGLSAALAAVEAGVPPHEMLLVDRLDALGGILPQCTHRGFGKREFGGTLTGSEFLAPLLAQYEAAHIATLLSTTVTNILPRYSNAQEEAAVQSSASTHNKDGSAAFRENSQDTPCLSNPAGSGGYSQDAHCIVELAGPHGTVSIGANALIFAAGCRERAIGSLPISGTRPSGIFTAGAAQRMVNLQHWNIGENVVILGSGDVGMIMAGTLTDLGHKILAVIEQEASVGGLKANKERYIDNLNIPLFTRTTLLQVFGHRRIEGVELLADGEKVCLPCDTLIVSVGLISETELLDPLYPTPPWIFKAGNARRVHSFIEGVVSDGASAGTAAAKYVVVTP